MKTITLLIPILCSFSLQAHVMGPISWGGPDNMMQSTSFTNRVTVPIMIQTYDKNDYDIFVDGIKYRTVTIPKNQTKKFMIPVPLREQTGKIEHHKICSVAAGNIRTKICTKVKAVWLKKPTSKKGTK